MSRGNRSTARHVPGRTPFWVVRLVQQHIGPHRHPHAAFREMLMHGEDELGQKVAAVGPAAARADPERGRPRRDVDLVQPDVEPRRCERAGEFIADLPKERDSLRVPRTQTPPATVLPEVGPGRAQPGLRLVPQ
jgi:hypothetical protein